MVALIGDAEMDEGNIFEALLEGWKHGLKNTWWVVDYNRQSLDAVVREGLWARFESMFRNFGWDVVILKHGTLQRQAFAEPGGDLLRRGLAQAAPRRPRRPGRPDPPHRAAFRRRSGAPHVQPGGS